LTAALAANQIATPALAAEPQSGFDERSILNEIQRQKIELELLKLRLAELQSGSSSEPIEVPPPLQGAPVHANGGLPATLHQGVALANNLERAGDPLAPPIHDPSASNALFDDLNRRLETLEKQAAKTATPKKSDDGWIDVSGEKWTVKLGGHVQLDYINWANADPAITGPAAAPGTSDYFEFRRLRLVADGTGYGVFDFRLQMTLEPETVGTTFPTNAQPTALVKDAYLSMNEIPGLGRMRVGHFFVPFSLEQVTNDTNNIFMERSIPTQGIFAADREVGLAFYDATDDYNVTWSYGVFFDDISESLKKRIDDNQGCRVSGRVTWLPYYDEPSNGRYLVHTGVGILHTEDQNDSVRFRARPQIHEGPRLIDSGALDANSYTTGNVELAVVWAEFTVQSEAFLSSVNMNAGDSENVYGAYVHVSYFLTGENRMFERFGQHGAQFGRNVPHSNFFLTPGCCGPGAWELKARTSWLGLDEVDSGHYNDLTVGCNWYWSDRTRVMFDYIHPWTSSETTFGSTQSDILAMRFDFNW
jgi:phosphate-selective porin OprO/OprP